MNRPLYESPQDVENERRVADKIAVAWNCTVSRLKRAYPVDYAIFTESKCRAFAELKCRRYTMAQLDSMGGFMLSMHKWAEARSLCNAAGVPFVVIVEDADGAVWWHRTTTFGNDGIVLGGRTDRGDDQDVEPVILLKASRFTAMLGTPHSRAA